MKKKIIIANWKMSLGHHQTLELAQAFLEEYKAQELPDVEVVLCPSFTVLSKIAEPLNKAGIGLGAQNCFWEEQGAYTGEISPQTLKKLGCNYVIIGHSERRSYLKEDNQMVNQKIKSALKNKLIPIICVGETFEERQDGNKDFVIMLQVNQALTGVELPAEQRLVIAYEPVWVIGSGQAVEPQEAEHTNQVIRQVLLDYFPPEIINEQIHLIYGGSVEPNNIKEFLALSMIEGALVGGASLEASTFWQLIKAAS